MRDALEWAGVKNLSNVPQQVVPAEQKNKQHRKIKNKLSRLISYANDEGVMNIKMDNGNVYLLTLKSHPYIPNHLQWYGNNTDYEFEMEQIKDLYKDYRKTKEQFSSTGNNFYKSEVERYEEKIKNQMVFNLPETKIEFLDEDYVRISNYDLKNPLNKIVEKGGSFYIDRYVEFYHERVSSIILDTNKIAEVVFYNNWSLMNRIIKDKSLLELINEK